eukprot:TRINITY_DN7566_c0_g2_i2.p1 TRINITY_DN7566_c0_g2~~TRINITY_DN7566_c0_g2_i2.p1  ORF type:complete len:667 (+),score=208.80 TRINITY_DN7566_c0_g2_i2:64-2064(+)
MADSVKAIVEALNKPPFEKNLTLIGFDAMTPVQLLQALNDVFAYIAPDHNLEVRNEDPEDTVVRFLSLLRMCKYKPTLPGAEFRAGLVAADRGVLYPIFSYLLGKLEELKKRAYLSNYLMKIDVPHDILQDDEVGKAHARYTELIDLFKETHKALDSLKSSGFSVGDIKTDIQHMEGEKTQLTKRLNRLKQKLEGVDQYEEMLEAARSLRLEHERSDELARQQEDQTEQRNLAEDRLRRTQEELRQVKATAVSGGPEGLLARLEDETKMYHFLATDKLPNAIAEKNKQLEDNKRILEGPAVTQSELNDLTRQIQEVTKEINVIQEKRLARPDGAEDQLSVFRKQAAIIAGKKNGTAEKLKDLEDELNGLQKEYESKKAEAAARGPRVPGGEEFQAFVARLRTKSTAYKQKKAQLTALQSEQVVVQRTIDILQQRYQTVKAELEAAERASGVAGSLMAQEKLEHVSLAKSELDEEKGATLDDISQMVNKLTETIASKKELLAPLIKELRELRSEKTALQPNYDEAKAEYEGLAAKLETSKSKEEKMVRAYREEVSADESRYHYLQNMIRRVQRQLQIVRDEEARYVGKLDGKSLRDTYQKRIQEQETMGKHLREKQKEVKEQHEPNLRQLDMWSDLAKVMKVKLKVAQQGGQEQQESVMQEEDRLVL